MLGYLVLIGSIIEMLRYLLLIGWLQRCWGTSSWLVDQWDAEAPRHDWLIREMPRAPRPNWLISETPRHLILIGSVRCRGTSSWLADQWDTEAPRPDLLIRDTGAPRPDWFSEIPRHLVMIGWSERPPRHLVLIGWSERCRGTSSWLVDQWYAKAPHPDSLNYGARDTNACRFYWFSIVVISKDVDIPRLDWSSRSRGRWWLASCVPRRTPAHCVRSAPPPGKTCLKIMEIINICSTYKGTELIDVPKFSLTHL